MNTLQVWQLPTLTWGDPTLPSALRHFTSEFDMGSGGTTALWPPDKYFLDIDLIFKTPLVLWVKPLGSLVLVSLTYRYAYTPSLSTSSS